jgi:cell division protein FtsX
MKATWHPHDNKSSDREHKQELPDSAFAFPKQRKEPMSDASHVRNAIARFDQVKDVSEADREQAFANLKAAAKHFKIDMPETSPHDLGSHPHTRNKTK